MESLIEMFCNFMFSFNMKKVELPINLRCKYKTYAGEGHLSYD